MIPKPADVVRYPAALVVDFWRTWLAVSPLFAVRVFLTAIQS